MSVDPESDFFTILRLRESAMHKVFSSHFRATRLASDIEAEPKDDASVEKSIKQVAREHANAKVLVLHALLEQ